MKIKWISLVVLLTMATAAILTTAAQAFKPYFDIEGDWDYKLRAAAADVDLTGKVASPIDDTYTAYLSPTVYDLLGEEVPIMEFVVLDSPEEGQGNVAGIGLALPMPGQVEPGSSSFMVMSMMATAMKRDLLEFYDETLVVTDTKTDDKFHFVMADSQGDMIEILVDADGLGYWYKTSELDEVLTTERLAQQKQAAQPAGKQVQTLRVDNFKLEIHSFKESKSLGSKTKPGTKFVLVYLTITNEGNETEALIPDFHFQIKDSQGRKFVSDSDAIMEIDNCLSGELFAPDIPESGVIAYNVPENATGWKIVAESIFD